MLHLLRQRLREASLRRHHRATLRKVAVIEGLGLPEELRLAAVSRVNRNFEQELDRYTKSD